MCGEDGGAAAASEPGVQGRRPLQTLPDASVVNIAVRIQHHPTRAARLPALLAQLRGFDDVTVVVDPEPAAKRDPWAAHRACLESLPDSASHLLVLQDDVVPVEAFHVKALQAITERPESVLLAFVPGFNNQIKQMRLAQQRQARYMEFWPGAYVPTVAIVYPREVVHGLLDWAERPERHDRVRRPLRGADDSLVAHYCRVRRLRPLALVPSIVEHDDTIASVSGLKRKGRQRRAALL